MRMLGILAPPRDSAACLVDDGIICAAAQEERFSRVKRDGGFPIAAIAYCLEEARIESTSDIDEIACYERQGSGRLDEAIHRALPEFRGRILYTRDEFPLTTRRGDATALGPAYATEEIREIVDRFDLPYHVIGRTDLPRTVAQLVADDKLVGLLQGRMDYGPRSMESRSILGRTSASARLNEGIQRRKASSPCESTELAAVDARKHPFLHAVLSAFGDLTGAPVILNEPFSTADEPMVCSPLDAYRCMMRTTLDCIVLEDILIWRHEQPIWQ